MGMTVHETQTKVRAALAIYPPESWPTELCETVLAALDPDDTDEARVLAELVYHAARLAPNDNTGLTKHAVWDIQQLMAALNPHVDLEPSELMCVALILARANERRLAGGAGSFPGSGRPIPTTAPLLRVVNG